MTSAVSNPVQRPLGDHVFEARLLAREARGVEATMWARLIYVAIAIVTIPGSSPSRLDAILTSVICAIGIGISVFGVRAARRRRGLTKAGLIGVGFDTTTLLVLPFSWYWGVGGPDAVLWSFLIKTDVGFLAMSFLAIHTLALRPLYPAIVTVAGALQQICFVGLALLDPRTVITTDPIANHFEGAVHLVFVSWRGFSVAIVGGCLVAVAAASRRMVVESVELELERAELRAQEMARVASAKLSGLTGLVAGLAHEINTPLGTLISGASSARIAAQRIDERVASVLDLDGLRRDRGFEKALSALEQTSGSSLAAGERIRAKIEALTRFARLDDAEIEAIDLREGLSEAPGLVPDAVRGQVEIVSELAPMPTVPCRAREVNQVFLTLVENAFEAMNGHGQLFLRAWSEGLLAHFEVEDTGPGIPEGEREGIFELRFSKKQARVGMGLCLPVGRRVMLDHGGDIRLETGARGGARFVIELPIEPEEPATADG